MQGGALTGDIDLSEQMVFEEFFEAVKRYSISDFGRLTDIFQWSKVRAYNHRVVILAFFFSTLGDSFCHSSSCQKTIPPLLTLSFQIAADA